MDLFSTDIHDEFNKAYYTVDLGPVLASGNPKKEVFVKFTDQSTGDGWGPGIFWMAVYSGTLQIESDRPVFSGLKAVNGEPSFGGATLLQRRYDVDSSKVLKEIVLPMASPLESSKPYLRCESAARKDRTDDSCPHARMPACPQWGSFHYAANRAFSLFVRLGRHTLASRAWQSPAVPAATIRGKCCRMRGGQCGAASR